MSLRGRGTYLSMWSSPAGLDLRQNNKEYCWRLPVVCVVDSFPWNCCLIKNLFSSRFTGLLLITSLLYTFLYCISNEYPYTILPLPDTAREISSRILGIHICCERVARCVVDVAIVRHGVAWNYLREKNLCNRTSCSNSTSVERRIVLRWWLMKSLTISSTCAVKGTCVEVNVTISFSRVSTTGMAGVDVVLTIADSVT